MGAWEFPPLSFSSLEEGPSARESKTMSHSASHHSLQLQQLPSVEGQSRQCVKLTEPVFAADQNEE